MTRNLQNVLGINKHICTSIFSVAHLMAMMIRWLSRKTGEGRSGKMPLSALKFDIIIIKSVLNNASEIKLFF